MLKYFIVFTMAGFATGYFVINKVNAILIILATSILWGFISTPEWGLVVLGEMSLGYFISVAVTKSLSSEG